MNGVFEKRGTWWIRYRADGKIRREPVTWDKIREAEIKVDPATEAEQPGKILAGKLYSHYITKRNRGERTAAISPSRKVFFRELIDLGVTRATERNAGWKIDLLRLEKLRAQFGDVMVQRLTPQMFEQWFATQGWAPSTFNRYKDAVRICFKRGVANNLIPDSMIPRIEHRKVGNNARVRYLNQFQPLPTDDPDLQFALTEEARLETVLLRDFPLYFDFYVIALDTGMRTGEQLEVTWDRVDSTRRQVSIHRSKTGKGRSIPLTGRALAAFQRLYDRPLRGEHCFLGLNGARSECEALV